MLSWMIQKTRLQILHWLAYSNDEKQTKEKKKKTQRHLNSLKKYSNDDFYQIR